MFQLWNIIELLVIDDDFNKVSWVKNTTEKECWKCCLKKVCMWVHIFRWFMIISNEVTFLRYEALRDVKFQLGILKIITKELYKLTMGQKLNNI